MSLPHSLCKLPKNYQKLANKTEHFIAVAISMQRKLILKQGALTVNKAQENVF